MPKPTEEEIQAFRDDILAVYQEHGLALAHEDHPRDMLAIHPLSDLLYGTVASARSDPRADWGG